MFRKRKQPSPYFKLPPPYQPITGEHAPMIAQGIYPYTAMMQVAAPDTHDDYVLCRGFDVRIAKFVDYSDGDATAPGISVAKPYGRRRTGTYRVGQVFPAILPLQTTNPSPTAVQWRVGENPGRATDTVGHPADLDEEVEFLLDDNGQYINWQLLDDPLDLIGGCLAEDHPGRGVVFGIWLGVWNIELNEWEYDSSGAFSEPAIDWRYGVPYPDHGATGLFTPRASETYGAIWEVVALDCTAPDDHTCVEGSLESPGEE